MIEDVTVLYRIQEITLILISFKNLYWCPEEPNLLLKDLCKDMIVILDSIVCRNGFTF